MKNQFNIRQFAVLNLIAIALVLMASCEKEITDETDITKSAWRVQFIEVDNSKTNTPDKDAHGNQIKSTAYILDFSNDSICSMSFSINQGGGKYYIESVGVIDIIINTMTEICCDSDFDTKLSQLFSEMREYKVINNTLILEGNNKIIQLKKE